MQLLANYMMNRKVLQNVWEFYSIAERSHGLYSYIVMTNIQKCYYVVCCRWCQWRYVILL